MDIINQEAEINSKSVLLNQNIEYDRLLNKKEELRRALLQYKTELVDLAVGQNAVNFIPHKVDPKKLKKRKELVSIITSIESQLSDVKKELNIFYKLENDIFKDVLKSVISPELFLEIYNEAKRRVKGLPHIAISIRLADIKEAKRNSQIYRKQLEEYHDMIVSAKQTINAYVRMKEPEINKAEFIKEISSLSKCLPHEQEMIRKRRNIGY